MLIPTAYQQLPDQSGCYNGRLLFGGTAAQIAASLAQMTHVKLLNHAFYYVGRLVAAAEGGRRYIHNNELKGATTYNFIYQSSPLSSHLALFVKYVSSNFNATTVLLDAKLRNTTSNSYTGAVLDVGIRFSESQLDSGPNTIHTAFTGCEMAAAPSNVYAPDPPRPLYVPVSNRGEALNIVITTTQLIPLTVEIYDVYAPEVDP